jgi:tripartite ATP-independent transporter DctP family solute receptor
MKKWFLIFLIVVMVLCMAISGYSVSCAAEPLELKWYQADSSEHPWVVVGELICEEVYKRSDGRLKMIQYPSGVLGTEYEAVDMLRMGSLAFLTSGPSILTSFDEDVQVFALPYLFRDKEHAYKAFKIKAVQDLFNDVILKKSGVRTIAFWYFGDRTLTANLPVYKPNDLAGVKIRCMDAPVFKDVIKALGANPIPVSFSELYLALQTGVVQGQENPIATIYDSKFYEVQDYIILTAHSVHMGTVHVSEKIWQQLSESDQKLILDVFEEYQPMIDQKIVEATKINLQKMIDDFGVEVIDPDMTAFKEYANEYIMGVYGEKWGDLIEQIQAVE